MNYSNLLLQAKLSVADCPIDYSEEAVPERDPGYALPDGTLFEAQTVEVLKKDARLALARHLVQLGMDAVRAGLVASL